MEIKCELCGEKIVVADDLVPGQHVRCPFCGGKFSHAVKRKEVTEDDLREAIAICRKNDEWNRYYKNAPAGAKLYIALVFYGKVFAGTLDKTEFVEAFKGVGPNLKARDLRYLLQYEDDEAMREYLSDRLASVCGDTGLVEGRKPNAEHSQRRITGEAFAPGGGEMPANGRKLRRGISSSASSSQAERKRTDWTGAVASVAVAAVVICAGAFLYRVWDERVKDKRRIRHERSALQKAISEKRNELNRCVKDANREVEDLRQMFASAANAMKDNKVRFRDVLAKIEAENNLRAGAAQAKGHLRFNAAELAMAILKSPSCEDIYRRCTGQSLAGKADEMRSCIRTAIGNRTTFPKDEVEGIDIICNVYVKRADKEIQKALSDGGEKVKSLRDEIRKIQNIVSDAADIAQGTDTNQMEVAMADVRRLRFSEIKKRLEWLAASPVKPPDAEMSEDEFVVESAKDASTGGTGAGRSQSTTQTAQSANEELPKLENEEKVPVKGEDPKQVQTVMPSREIVSATKKTKLSGMQGERFVELNRTCGECIITGEYVVPKGCELVIREGVKVVFSLRSGLTVLGKLAVLGTKESPIILKGNGSGLNAWAGIKMARSENVQISYAHISGAIVALSVDASSLRVENSTFYRNFQVGKICDCGGDVAFVDCLMTGNVKGAHYHFSKVGFEHCSFLDNKEYAITGSYYGDIALDGCVVVRNGFGIQDGGYGGTLQAHNCTICDNRKFDVTNSSSVPADLTRNWWGKKNTALLLRTPGRGVRLPKVIGRFPNIAEFLTEMPADCGTRGSPSKTLR